MIPCYYTSLQLHRLALAELQAYYAEWALGAGRFRSLRERRRDSGIPANLHPDKLRTSATHHGRFEARLDVRASQDNWLMHMSHRDTAEPAVLWHTVVHLETAAPGVRLEHGVGRSVPPGAPTNVVVAPPAILPKIIEWNGPNLAPRDLVDSSLLLLPAADAAQFTEHILCERSRGIAMLVFSAGARPTVDGSLVDRGLVGLARVVCATEAEAAADMSSQLLRSGFDQRFRVLDGAVRLFLPGLTPSDDPYRHRLWIADRLANMGRTPPERASVLTREVAQVVLRRCVPHAYFSSIARYDREQQEKTRMGLLAASALQGGARRSEAELSVATVMVRELKEFINAQAEEIKGLQTANEQLEYDKLGLDDQLSAGAQQREELEGELRSKQAIIAHQGSEMDRLKLAAAAGDVPQATRDAIAAVVVGSANIEQGLLAVQALFPEQITVLPTAMRSAKDSREFKYAGRAIDYLVKFGSQYWRALCSGEGDGAGRRIFGQAFAATESESVMTNSRAKRLRTFRYQDKDVLMCPHLKIGVKDSAVETWRMHFEWIAAERKLVIGHCGPHLDQG